MFHAADRGGVIPKAGQILNANLVKLRPLSEQVGNRQRVNQAAIKGKVYHRPVNELVSEDVEIRCLDNRLRIAEGVRRAQDAAEDGAFGVAVMRRQSLIVHFLRVGLRPDVFSVFRLGHLLG